MLKDFSLIGDSFFDSKTVKEAPDPTDIIWENRHFTEHDICVR